MKSDEEKYLAEEKKYIQNRRIINIKKYSRCKKSAHHQTEISFSYKDRSVQKNHCSGTYQKKHCGHVSLSAGRLRKESYSAVNKKHDKHLALFPDIQSKKLRINFYKNIGNQHSVNPDPPVGHIGKTIEHMPGKGYQKKYIQKKEPRLQRCI